ncbi:MAG: phage tail protein [Ruminococcus sp.]|nr:phage tail protein [Candidatus Copronaster equi]
MTPKLYNNSLELIGFLKDIISCTVTEKRNGMYECEFIYPLAGELYDELKEDCYILTKSNDNDPLQFFRIYSKSPEIRGKTTYKAEHISYLLNSNPIEAVKVENSSASTAINAIKDAAKISQGFTFTSDVNGLGSIDLQALSVKQALGGIEGSLLDVFGGEYYYNNKSVKL